MALYKLKVYKGYFDTFIYCNIYDCHYGDITLHNYSSILLFIPIVCLNGRSARARSNS